MNEMPDIFPGWVGEPDPDEPTYATCDECLMVFRTTFAEIPLNAPVRCPSCNTQKQIEWYQRYPDLYAMEQRTQCWNDHYADMLDRYLEKEFGL